jgi:hypothetical protein
MIYGTLIVLGSIVGVGWTAHEVIPTRTDLAEVHEAVIVAGSKADVALDRQMEALIAAIARLEAKPNKSPEVGKSSQGQERAMNEWKPKRKVSAGVVGAGLTALLFWLLEQKYGSRPPPGVEAMCTGLIAFGVSWLVPDKYEADE